MLTLAHVCIDQFVSLSTWMSPVYDDMARYGLRGVGILRTRRLTQLSNLFAEGRRNFSGGNVIITDRLLLDLQQQTLHIGLYRGREM